MTEAIPFSNDLSVSMLEIESVQASVIGVESMQVSVLPVEAVFSGSLLQMFQDFLSLDGGRPLDEFSGITPLDGGGA